MGTITPDFFIEPFLEQQMVGSNFNIVAEVVYTGPGMTICKSVVHHQIFYTDVSMKSKGVVVTILNSNLERVSGKTWLMQTVDTHTIMHSSPSQDSILQLVEACAGIGAVGLGFKASGFQTVARAEMNPVYCKWLSDHNHQHVIQGDIAEASVIRAIAEHCSGPPTVTAGFSCQPFSNLGDKLEERDSRSMALPAVLKLGHFLRAPIIILECTKGAMTSSWVQMILKRFQQDTGYAVHQQITDLHCLWPSHRTRWWAVLTAPFLNCASVPEPPTIGWSPGILHLMPKLLDLSPDELKQLELSPYELRYFHSMGQGIGSHVINLAKAMPTATHSWGSQVLPCHCGCRKGGFTMERLDNKGLYGILIPLGKTLLVDGEELSTFRHPHPQEVALLNGCLPSLVKPSSKSTLRLDLSGIGQMATPLQSAWIGANILKSIHEQGIIDFPTNPIAIVKKVCQDLLQERDEILGVTKQTTYMKIFEEAIRKLGHDQLPPKDEIESHGAFTQALLAVVKKAEKHAEPPIPKVGFRLDPINSIEEKEVIQPILCQSITMQQSERSPVDTCEEEVLPPLQFPDPHVLDRWCVKESCTGVKLPMTDAGIDIVEEDFPNAYSEAGGIQLFSAKECEEPPCKKAKTEGDRPQQADPDVKTDLDNIKHAEPITPTIPWTSVAREDQESGTANIHQEAPGNIFWIGHTDQTIFPVRINGPSTVGQATQAEAKLHNLPVTIKPMNGVGSDLSLSQTVQPDDVILIRQCGECDKDKCIRAKCNYLFAPKGNEVPNFQDSLTREEILWNQRGWVAFDEMTFYLDTLKNEGQINTSPPLYFNEDTSQVVVWGDWVVRASEIAAATNMQYEICSVIWHDHHWFPVRLEIKESEVTITTTPLESDFIHHISKEAFGDYDFSLQVLDINHKFPADCGFQSIAWIAALARNQPGQTCIEASEALALRKQFAQHLANHSLHNKPCTEVTLGGMNHGAAMKELQDLLESHGVSQNRLKEHTQTVITRLSIGEVIKTLQSPRPWADLKAKANSLRPPLQLVLAEELKIAVDARLKGGKSFGKKQYKQHSQGIPQSSIRLHSAHVQVPTGIFQQTDGTKLTQITHLQINPQAKGFAVVNIDDALPFFDIHDPIGKAGIALFILDHQDKRIPEHCKTIRFPAQYAETDEPVIVTAAVLQLGQQTVQRFVPDTCAKIDEVATSVIRIMAYKDQYRDHDWNNFKDRPVKCLMEQPAFQMLPKNAVIDVWDRQFVSKSFKKSRAPEAEIFIVTIRVEQQFAPELLEISGKDGIYTEPRDDAGRNPHPSYKVVWIPKASFGDLVVAKQKTEGPSWITRNGDRYGIRVEAEHERTAHQLHRPEVDFIGGELKQYRIGPLPFGTNKSSLSKAFRLWNWEARAGQPLTQTRDHSGVFWSAQAACNPSHWIFTMQHGDVLISQEPSREDSLKPSQSIVASTRTIQRITSGKNDATVADPWLKDDPWAPKNPQTSKALSVSQVAAIEQNIEKRIRANMTSSDDAAMESVLDDRVTQMEQQMKHIQESFGSFQSQQQAHNVQVAHELTAVRNQVDAQTTGFQQILADKLEEQMSKIDALLNKRQRNE